MKEHVTSVSQSCIFSLLVLSRSPGALVTVFDIRGQYNQLKKKVVFKMKDESLIYMVAQVTVEG